MVNVGPGAVLACQVVNGATQQNHIRRAMRTYRAHRITTVINVGNAGDHAHCEQFQRNRKKRF